MLKYSIEGDVLYSGHDLICDGKEMPDEELLHKAYVEAIRGALPRSLTVRIQPLMQDMEASNQHFHSQLRALLRASVHGKLRILFSRISCLEQMVAVKIALAKAQQDLSFEGVAYREEILLGIAIETPSAAVISDVLAQECDYFIIDTQNLIRYSLALDYTDQQIMEYETIYNPSIFMLIKSAIDGAHKGGLPCGICGEAAEDFRVIPALIGFGVNQLFMNKDRVVYASEIIFRIAAESYVELANGLLMARTHSEVIELLESLENPAVYAGKS